MHAPFRSPAFAWFLGGQSVSLFGSAMAPIALAFAVLDATHSSSALGIVLAANVIPHLALLMFGGATADRFSRRTVLLIANSGSALTQGAVATILLGGHFSLPAIAALEFANGALSAFTTPALRGVLPQLVAPDRVQRANSLLGSARNAAKIAGPSDAGLLVATLGSGPAIAFDAATYAVAAICLLQVRLQRTPIRARGHIVRDIREGIALFRRTPWLWPVSLAFCLVNLVQTGTRQVLGPELASAQGGPQTWGFMLSARGVGLLVMSAIMYRVVLRRLLPIGQLASVLGAAPLIVLGLGAGAPWLLSAGFIGGLGSSLCDLGWNTTLQTHISGEALSRVASLDDLLSYAVIPIGQLAVGPLAYVFGAHEVCLAAGAVWIIAVLLPLARRAVRTLPTAPADQAATVASGGGSPGLSGGG